MYLEFLYVILDYFSVLTKKEKRFEWGLPILLGGISLYLYVGDSMQYDFIKNIIDFIGVLLGFTLTALTLILSSERIKSNTQKHPTDRKIRGKTISLYRLIVVPFTYLITMESLLCLFFYIGSLFSSISLGMWAVIPNTFFIILSLNIILSTVRATTMLYFIVIR